MIIITITIKKIVNKVHNFLKKDLYTSNSISKKWKAMQKTLLKV